MELTPVVAMEGFKPSNGGVKVLCLHHLATPHYNLAFLHGKPKPHGCGYENRTRPILLMRQFSTPALSSAILKQAYFTTGLANQVSVQFLRVRHSYIIVPLNSPTTFSLERHN